ncbi:hypothetical protein GCM10009087_13280 [Sphingomonas oligophenolica]|uniref:Nuclear transport factor 2 family protein n=1 Tax=Sphingomonas oligophenolica TaxID=301154 RepID=A0ABU9YBY5_9SPHN
MTKETPTSTDDLASQLQLLLDEREITRLLLALSRTVDQKDFIGLASLYAVDGALITPRGTHRGRAGLAEFVAKDIGHYAALHHISAAHDINIHPGAETASARMTLHATHVSDSAAMAFDTVGGFYDFQLIREDGQWRIKENRIHPQWHFEVPGRTPVTHPGNER